MPAGGPRAWPFSLTGAGNSDRRKAERQPSERQAELAANGPVGELRVVHVDVELLRRPPELLRDPLLDLLDAAFRRCTRQAVGILEQGDLDRPVRAFDALVDVGRRRRLDLLPPDLEAELPLLRLPHGHERLAATVVVASQDFLVALELRRELRRRRPGERRD